MFIPPPTSGSLVDFWNKPLLWTTTWRCFKLVWWWWLFHQFGDVLHQFSLFHQFGDVYYTSLVWRRWGWRSRCSCKFSWQTLCLLSTCLALCNFFMLLLQIWFGQTNKSNKSYSYRCNTAFYICFLVVCFSVPRAIAVTTGIITKVSASNVHWGRCEGSTTDLG